MISDTSKKHPESLDSDNEINLSSLIVILELTVDELVDGRHNLMMHSLQHR
jgi:hypothetical protein